jgi:hypothetical protein
MTTDFLRSLVDVAALTSLLDGCIIKSTYAVPSQLADAFVLTEEGEAVLKSLISQNRKVRRNEARLAVGLAVGKGDALYVDPQKTNTSAISAALTSEILRGRILYPKPYGKSLAIRLAKDHPNANNLNSKDTLKFLTGTSIGTYQIGPWVVGPYGCHRSSQYRSMPPRRHVSAFFCEDIRCNTVHSVALSTGDAPIVRARVQASENSWMRPFPRPRRLSWTSFI